MSEEIIARIHSTNGAVSSLADHDAAQLIHARAWLADQDEEIQAFTKRLVESLERSHERHSAYEADDRHQWGAQ